MIFLFVWKDEDLESLRIFSAQEDCIFAFCKIKILALHCLGLYLLMNSVWLIIGLID